MYVVAVQFQLHPDAADDFRREVMANARASLSREKACRQFDVCVDPEVPDSVFLYEVYDAKAAFEAHLASGHFKRFNELTSPWVQKQNRRLLRAAPPLRLTFESAIASTTGQLGVPCELRRDSE